MVNATCIAIWLKSLLKDLQVEVSDPTTIYCNNLNIFQFAKNLVSHAQTKYIKVHYHFVQEHILSGEMEQLHVPTNRQVGNIFTKIQGLDKLQQFSGAMSVQYLDLANLRGRIYKRNEKDDKEAKSNTDFKSRVIKEVELHKTATKAKTQHKEPPRRRAQPRGNRKSKRQSQKYQDIDIGRHNYGPMS